MHRIALSPGQGWTAGGSSHLSVSDGPNDRARNETIAGTAPGIADDALGPGEEDARSAQRRGDGADAKKLGAATADRH
jgi:hypothetical protein